MSIILDLQGAMHLHCLHIFREPHMLLTSHSQSKQYIYRFLFHAFFRKSQWVLGHLKQLFAQWRIAHPHRNRINPATLPSAGKHLQFTQKSEDLQSLFLSQLQAGIQHEMINSHDYRIRTHYPPTSIILGHPLLPLTPGAFSLIQACSVATLVYTTGSRQQLYWFIMHPLNTPAAMYLHSYY